MDDMIDTCWKLFNETGEINYYLLYKTLKKNK